MYLCLLSHLHCDSTSTIGQLGKCSVAPCTVPVDSVLQKKVTSSESAKQKLGLVLGILTHFMKSTVNTFNTDI